MDSEILRSHLQCPICTVIPRRVSIYQCVNGHVICATCLRKCGGEVCPVGRCGYDRPQPARNRFLENLVHGCGLEFDCQNADRGCGVMLQPEQLRLHEDRECPFRTVSCSIDSDCDEEFLACEEREHRRQYHIACPNADKGCGFVGRRIRLSMHEAECGYISIICPYGDCGQEILLKDAELHNAMKHIACKFAECGCDFRSDVFAVVVHEEAHCPHRRIRCTYPGCGAEIPAKDISQHNALRHIGCKNAEAGCGFTADLLDVVRHEKVCAFRKVSCPISYRGGGCSDVRKCKVMEHIKKEHEAELDLDLNSSSVEGKFQEVTFHAKDTLFVRCIDDHEFGLRVTRAAEDAFLRAWIYLLAGDSPSTAFEARIEAENGDEFRAEKSCRVHSTCEGYAESIEEEVFELSPRQQRQLRSNDDRDEDKVNDAASIRLRFRVSKAYEIE